MNAIRILVLLAMLPGSRIAQAQEKPPAIELSYPGQPEAAVRRPNGTPVASHAIHAYGGEPLRFDLAVQAPAGTRLRVFADVVQVVGGGLAAGVQRNVSVGPELVFEQCTSLVAPCALSALPLVRAKTRMLLTLRTEPTNADLPGGLVVPLIVYPREEPGAWEKMLAGGLARGGLRRVAVFGGGQGLRRFLSERKVSFEDLGESWPTEPDTRTLYVAELPPNGDTLTPLAVPQPFSDLPGARLLLFAPNASDPLPAGVYQTIDPAGGSVCKVSLPDLFAEPARHPERIEILAELFREALAARVPSTTVKP